MEQPASMKVIFAIAIATGFTVVMLLYFRSVVYRENDLRKHAEEELRHIKKDLHDSQMQNVTDRKIMDREIQEARHFLELVIGSSPLAIILHDAQGNIEQWNPASEKLFGWSEMEVVGKLPPIIPTEHLPLFRETLAYIFSGNNQNLLDKPLLRKDGSIISCDISIGLLRGANEEAKGMVAIITNITKRKKAEEEINQQLQHLRALREIDLAIRGSTDVYLSLKTILDCTLSELHVDAADFFLLDPHINSLKYMVGCGFRSKDRVRPDLRMAQGFATARMLEHKALHIVNLAEAADELISESLIESEGFVEYYAIPLIVKGNVSGLLEIFQRNPLDLNQDWLDFLHSLAGQAAMAIEDYQLVKSLHRANQDLLQAYDETIEGWSHALDLRDKETEGHSRNVAEMTVKLARFASISDEELIQIRRGALLHDIGKMGVPDSILLKHDKLTDEEWAVMRKHPVFAFELLSPIACLHSALDIPYCHHEKWDGSGYPRGLNGSQIPLAARLFAVIDVWEALTSDRPYREGWTKEHVIEHIKSLSGTHFDPKIVELFLNMINLDDPLKTPVRGMY
jgi:PAS domain S-box-containing protein